ncbi:C-factor [Diplodia seriata]|nr:C-factor [Diplodia seriata]
MICKNLSVELKDKGVVVVILHPGMVRTAMAAQLGPVPGLVDPDEVAGKLYKILVSKKLEDTGKFWHRDGQELPW